MTFSPTSRYASTRGTSISPTAPLAISIIFNHQKQHHQNHNHNHNHHVERSVCIFFVFGLCVCLAGSSSRKSEHAASRVKYIKDQPTILKLCDQTKPPERGEIHPNLRTICQSLVIHPNKNAATVTIYMPFHND